MNKKQGIHSHPPQVCKRVYSKVHGWFSCGETGLVRTFGGWAFADPLFCTLCAVKFRKGSWLWQCSLLFAVCWELRLRAAAKCRRESWRCKTISELMINEQIRDREIRLIGENGEQLGIMSARDAYKLAQEAELDLVKIAPTAKPPVCKIIDYGKYKYEMLRKEKEARKKQKTTEVKEIRLSPNIDDNDLNTKANQARKFITKGDKVKISLRFRGREMAHINSSRQILDDFVEKLSDIAVLDKPAKVEGRSMIVFLSEKHS